MDTMGERGQAFSTFKLLIAAIVAVVILVILLSILGYIDFSPRREPIVGAADSLKEAYQTPSQLVTTNQAVTFSRDYTLSREAIVERANIGISKEQICLSLGDYTPLTASGFDKTATRILYKGGSPRDVKISALCYRPGDRLPDLMGTGVDAIYENLDPSWVAGCDCAGGDADLSKDICCMIALRIPR